MLFGPVVFRDDVELTEPVSSLGPLTARGNLIAHASIKVNGPLSASKNLEISVSLKTNGPMTVKGSLICQKDASAKVNGPVIIKKGMIGGLVRINGPLTASYVEVRKLSVNGPVSVQEDIVAEEEIFFGVGYTRKKHFDVGGIIEAPIIHIKNQSSKYSVSGIVRKVFGLNTKYNRIIIIEGLTIRTKLLRLEGVELENCDIQCDEIEHVDPIDE
jgi:rRNA processing protein Gar1